MTLKRSALISLLLASFAQLNAQVVDPITPADAVSALLGDGIDAFNISYTGGEGQMGYLSAADGTIFPIAEGVLLSTDLAENFDPTGTPGILTGTVSGDPDLLDIANSVPPLIGQSFSVSAANDLCILEFDFTPQGDSLSFNYSFGSDEYLEWVNSSFNDVFAFFLSGPGISGPYASPIGFPDGAINIAILPNSDPELPITISSVNDVLNSAYYIDNFNNVDVNQDGFTVSLTAAASVNCGDTYHIKLAIADGTDTALESIVVLEAGSFSSSEPGIVANIDNTGITVPDNTFIEGCLDGFVTITKAQCDESTTLDLVFGGTAEMGIDFENIESTIEFPVGESSVDVPVVTILDDINEGTESIEISFSYIDFLGDTITAATTIYIMDYIPAVASVEDVSVCPQGSVDVSIDISDGISPFEISWSNGDSGENATYDGSLMGEQFATVTDYCGGNANFNFTIIDYMPMNLSIEDVFVCAEGTSEATVDVSAGIGPFNYSWSNGDTGAIANYTSSDVGDNFVMVFDSCDETDSIHFNVTQPDLMELSNIDEYYCVGLDTDVLVSGGTPPFSFDYASEELINLENGGFFSDVEGIYNIVVIDACLAELEFTLVYQFCETVFPNVFTPTNSPNDVANNAFVVDGIQGFPGSGLKVYNRWGNLVYENSNYFNTWDGGDNPDGLYYYILERSDGKTFSGNVHILRKKP